MDPKGRIGIAFERSGNGWGLYWDGRQVVALPEFMPTAVLTMDYTARVNEIVLCDPTSAGFTVTLPAAAKCKGQKITVKNQTSSTNTITIATDDQAEIDGAATASIASGYEAMTLVSDGSDWWTLCCDSGVGGGGVTSVALVMPSGVFDVAGSPITGSGTFTVTFDNQTANTIFAGPTTGAAAAPTFRAMVTADIGNGIVTLAKLENIATDRLLGRDTAGSGAVEQLTVGGGVEFTGSGGIQRSALTGDVTASAGSGSTTIANDAVTYAKMQNVSATSRVLGRRTAGAGDPEECTASQVLDFIGATQGTVLYRGAAGWAVLAVGTDGEVLTTHGAGADPSWDPVTATSISFADITSGVNVSALMQVDTGAEIEFLENGTCTFIKSFAIVGATAPATPGTGTRLVYYDGTMQMAVIKDDDGVVRPIDDTQYLRATSDQSRNATTLADSAELVFNPTSSTSYHFKFVIRWQSDSTASGIKLAINSAAAMDFILYSVRTMLTTSTESVHYARALDDAGVSASIDAANTDSLAIVEGILRTSGSVAPIYLRFAAEGAGATVTLKTGSLGMISKST